MGLTDYDDDNDLTIYDRWARDRIDGNRIGCECPRGKEAPGHSSQGICDFPAIDILEDRDGDLWALCRNCRSHTPSRN